MWILWHTAHKRSEQKDGTIRSHPDNVPIKEEGFMNSPSYQNWAKLIDIFAFEKIRRKRWIRGITQSSKTVIPP
jgi:hypothetical protein